MKKLMVSTIILLPLLILLIMLVSGAIMSLVTHIYVEQVEFVDDDTLVLVLSDEGNPPSAKCEVNILPLKASNRDIAFKSGDDQIVTIDDSGVVKAQYFGETFVTVSSIENKAAVAQRKVLVTDNKVHAVKIQSFEDNLYNGDTRRLVVDIVPAEATNQGIEWTSSNPAVLAVSATGEVICHGAGEVTVTARSTDQPDVEDTVTIHCFQQLESISLEGGAHNEAELTTDREAQFPTVLPFPADATYTVEYTTSDENVATVDENGKISFKKAGYVTITATASDVKGNTDAESVSYHCTDGYFEMGSLFPKNSDSIDYDAYAGKPLSAIKLKIVQGVAYREIVSVAYGFNGESYDNDGDNKFDLIHYDDKTNEFTLATDYNKKLGDVTITVTSKKYNRENALIEVYKDTCTVTVTRKAQSIKFVDANGDNPSQTVQTKSVTFAEGNVTSGIGMIVTPANHTDTLVWTVKEEDKATASFTSANTLTFEKEGTATVVATIVGNETVDSKLTLTYTVPKAEDKPVKVGGSSPAPQNITLKYNDNGECGDCVLDVTPPEGMKAVCESDHEDIIKVDPETLHLIPQDKGGFAEITVNFVASVVKMTAYTADERVQPIKFKIYVDKPVDASNVEIKPTIDLTQNESVGYTVTFKNITADALAGKEVTIDGVKATMTESDGLKAYTTTYSFKPTEDEHDIKVTVSYTSEAEACNPEKKGELFTASHKVRTTHGKLKSVPVVKVKGGATFNKDSDNVITFADLDQTIELEISTIPNAQAGDPLDFTLTEEQIAFAYSGQNLTYKILNVKDNKATVQITSANVLNGVTENNATLTVANNIFNVKAKVNSLANKIEVKYKDAALLSTNTYNTLLKKLALKVIISRTDNKAVTQITASWSKGGAGQTDITITNGQGTLEGDVTLELAGGENTFTFKTGNTTYNVTIDRHVLSQDDFKSFILQYQSGGATRQHGPYNFPDEQSVNFPSNIQGAFELFVQVPALEGEDVSEGGNVIKGFDLTGNDSEITSLLKVTFEDTAHTWATPTVQVTQDEEQGAWKITFTVTIPTDEVFTNVQMNFACGNNVAKLTLGRVELVKIEFPDYDMSKKNNGGDVYKGYQQVRVFAKHSDYGKDLIGGNIVDYLRIPVNAVSEIVFNTPANPESIMWKLTAVDDETEQSTQELVSQQGKKLTYRGKEYTITHDTDGDSILKDAEGKTIAQNGKYEEGVEQVPWVDVFAEDGYAHLYFGNFVGLSETDVQNDFFGNFAEEAEWAAVADRKDIEGKDVTPSEGAFKYLKVEAGDGKSVNTHFNFNVLQDDALVNVFNATGYYANSNIVLHNDLYGDGELDPSLESTKKDQILDQAPQRNSSDPAYAKDTIYGNGYQVNLNKLNDMIVGTGSTSSGGMMNHDGQENTGNATHFTSLYNVRMMGRNSDEKVNSAKFAILFNIKNVYYTDLQNYSKMTPKGGSVSIKNSVLHNVAVQALQLWNEASEPVATRGFWKAYLENVTIVNATKCISIEGSADKATSKYHTLYIKGFLDVLNYYSFSTLKNMAAAVADDGMVVSILSASLRFGQAPISNYVEWYGQKQDAEADLTTYNQEKYGGDGVQFKGQDKVFVNPIIVDTAIDGQTKLYGTWGDSVSGVGGKIKSWNGTEYVDVEANTNGIKVAHPLSGMDHNASGLGNGLITAYTYASTNESDGGHVDDAATFSKYNQYKTESDKVFRVYLSRPDLGKLFTNERDIRLLCEYVDIEDDGTPILNTDHILWHMQKAHRNVNIIEGRTQDHSEALKESLINAKAKYGWDGEWPDGTTLEEALQAEKDAAAQKTAQAASNLLSSALPERRQFAA